jgi:hypothetical protein
MQTVRERVLQRFLPQGAVFLPEGGANEADETLSAALYDMLRTLDALDVCVDGWEFFRVIHESADVLDTVGVMTLLPDGFAPIALRFTRTDRGFDWSVDVARQDDPWLSRAESSRWKDLHLYASGEQGSPPWAWGRRYEGSVPWDEQVIAEAWAEAARDLKLGIESPFVLVAPDGRRFEYITLIRDFGSAQGTLLCLPDQWDQGGYDELAELHGFYCPGLYPEAYEHYNREEFIATLQDWGWFGEGNPPMWYSEGASTENRRAPEAES